MRCSQRKCKLEAVTGRRMCAHHREWFRLWQIAKRKRATENGTCHRGDCKILTSSYYCPKHAREQNNRRNMGCGRTTGEPTEAELEATIAEQLLCLPRWWEAEQARHEAARIESGPRVGWQGLLVRMDRRRNGAAAM